MLRECETWGIWKKRRTRWWHRLKYGHARHHCKILRQFGCYHEGPHECRCGVKYDQLLSDND